MCRMLTYYCIYHTTEIFASLSFAMPNDGASNSPFNSITFRTGYLLMHHNEGWPRNTFENKYTVNVTMLLSFQCEPFLCGKCLCSPSCLRVYITNKWPTDGCGCGSQDWGLQVFPSTPLHITWLTAAMVDVSTTVNSKLCGLANANVCRRKFLWIIKYPWIFQKCFITKFSRCTVCHKAGCQIKFVCGNSTMKQSDSRYFSIFTLF